MPPSLSHFHFNPRSPRGERPSDDDTRCNARYFNPRSPRGERQRRILELAYLGPFQSTLPARGATRYGRSSVGCGSVFQSTLPARGATGSAPQADRLHYRFQSTLPARGATRFPAPPDRRCGISIHAPREGSDPRRSQLTQMHSRISIHAPREGSDARFRPPRGGLGNFNPRSPRGERPV